MNCQMIRVISSPSSSTTVPSTLILLTSAFPSLRVLRGAVGDGRRSELGDVGLLGADGLGRLAEPGQLTVGEVGLDDLAHALAADLRLDAEVDPGDAVLPVDPGAHRHAGAGVLDHRAGHPGRGGG